MTAQSPVGSSTRLPVKLTGEPQVCPVVKSKKHREPTLVLPTTEKAIRFCVLRSAVFERRKRLCQACQLPMMLWMARPQSSKRECHTQMSIEFQLTVSTPVSQPTKRQRNTSFSACPCVLGPPKTKPDFTRRK